jgi:hypothetical protein
MIACWFPDGQPLVFQALGTRPPSCSRLIAVIYIGLPSAEICLTRHHTILDLSGIDPVDATSDSLCLRSLSLRSGRPELAAAMLLVARQTWQTPPCFPPL